MGFLPVILMGAYHCIEEAIKMGTIDRQKWLSDEKSREQNVRILPKQFVPKYLLQKEPTQSVTTMKSKFKLAF
jgi:hypothetical protein